jgi:uncharacterized membrane protein
MESDQRDDAAENRPMSPIPLRGDTTPTVETALGRYHQARRFIVSKLTWSRLYRATSYLKSALWTVPLFAIVIELLITAPLHAVDEWLHWRLGGLGVAGATAMYQTVITLTLSFLVFTFGSLLVAIQVASGQLTPRIIATTLLRDNVVRYSVGLFVFTLVFAVSAINRLEESVHELVTLLTAMLGVACIADFLFLIDYAARLLRPVSVVARVGDEGRAVIESVYPGPAMELPDSAMWRAPNDTATRVALHQGKSEIVLAVQLPVLVAMARASDGVIEFVQQVGGFVATDEPLFVLYGGAVALDDRKLQATVAFGPERTLEQDPMFAFRILVDIALKALSPAINDPTTSVLALDQVHRLLRVVGKRQLRGEIVPDESDKPRVIFRTPNWEDFVHVGCNEIRTFGANSVQAVRRLRAMLLDLLKCLPPQRHPALQQELDRLDQTIERLYVLPGDLALARIPDSQGLGGSLEIRIASPR